jgi:hypothetical protein
MGSWASLIHQLEDRSFVNVIRGDGLFHLGTVKVHALDLGSDEKALIAPPSQTKVRKYISELKMPKLIDLCENPVEPELFVEIRLPII